MSQQAGVLDLTFKAGADLSDKQYYIVYVSAADTVNVCGANGKAIGVLQNKPKSGEAAVVRVGGTTKVIMNEAAAVGKYITSTSAGKGEIADAAGEHVIGILLEAATAQDDIVEMLITTFTAHASDA